jgi:hypothetical protein
MGGAFEILTEPGQRFFVRQGGCRPLQIDRAAIE